MQKGRLLCMHDRRDYAVHGRIMFTLLLLIGALVLIIVIGHATFARLILAAVARQVTGCTVSMGTLDVGFMDSDFLARNVIFMSPEGFGDEPLATADTVFVDYEPGPLLHGRVHLTRMKLHVTQINLVRNRDGRLNIEAVNEKMRGRGEVHVDGDKTGGGGEKREDSLFIEQATVTVGNVLYKDYSAGSPAPVTRIPLNFEKLELRNVSGADVAEAVRVLINAAKR